MILLFGVLYVGAGLWWITQGPKFSQGKIWQNYWFYASIGAWLFGIATTWYIVSTFISLLCLVLVCIETYEQFVRDKVVIKSIDAYVWGLVVSAMMLLVWNIFT